MDSNFILTLHKRPQEFWGEGVNVTLSDPWHQSVWRSPTKCPTGRGGSNGPWKSRNRDFRGTESSPGQGSSNPVRLSLRRVGQYLPITRVECWEAKVLNFWFFYLKLHKFPSSCRVGQHRRVIISCCYLTITFLFNRVIPTPVTLSTP